MPAFQPAARCCFVEASAGTGKTHTLVTEIAAAIESGVPIDRIAAVTLTFAAAGSMKVRVRQELERRKNQGEALRSLDRAFIGTIHSFCAHLLRQRPVEACVDPDFHELDDPNARALFDGVFRDWLAAKLNDPGPVLRRALSRLAWSEERSPEGPVEKFRDAAWQLTAWRDHDAPWEIRDIDLRGRMLALFERVKRLEAMLRVARRAADPLALCLKPVQELRQRIRTAKEAGAGDPDEVENELLSLKFRIKYFEDKQGQGDWGGGVTRTQVISAWRDLNDAIEAFRADADADLASRLLPELWQVVQHYQQAKRRSGNLDFQDLLIYARDLLRHPDARRDLQARYDRIFIDEFQDTDPLQAEILLALCGNKEIDNPAQTGKLFVVGDPKQSIYRFCRADARQYRRIRDSLLSGGLGNRHLAGRTPFHRCVARIRERGIREHARRTASYRGRPVSRNAACRGGFAHSAPACFALQIREGCGAASARDHRRVCALASPQQRVDRPGRRWSAPPNPPGRYLHPFSKNRQL